MDAGATFAESYNSLERLPRWADVAISPTTAVITENGSDIMYRDRIMALMLTFEY